MINSRNFFKYIRENPELFYIIHYSSQSLFDAGANTLSPRITSIVVMHYGSRQIVSFALHAVAESLQIPKDRIEDRYDEIEGELLERFYNFARDRREKYWVHWNMRNLTFGFEHLEHRYRVLCKSEPPSISVEMRLNLNDTLQEQYGSNYASNPKMLSLMSLNGERVQSVLTGAEEAEAFKQKEFIRMHASTISKVEFFRHVINKAMSGKLKTAEKGFIIFIDKLLDGRPARVITFFGTIIAIPATIYSIIMAFL